jgi:hypothetical protein
MTNRRIKKRISQLLAGWDEVKYETDETNRKPQSQKNRAQNPASLQANCEQM